MIGGLSLLAASVTLTVLSGLNLRNCIFKGTTSAYGRVYSRRENPTSFWVSATCSVVAVLFGIALALTAVAGILGRLK